MLILPGAHQLDGMCCRFDINTQRMHSLYFIHINVLFALLPELNDFTHKLPVGGMKRAVDSRAQRYGVSISQEVSSFPEFVWRVES